MLIVLVGESGCGKTSVLNYIINKTKYTKVITATTRGKRIGETQSDYMFLSESDFSTKKSNGFFLETATYNGWMYGTPLSELGTNKIVILTPRGMRSLKKSGIPFISVYINVDRRSRLIKILERGDSIEEAYRRSVSDIGMFDGVSDEVDLTIPNPNYTLSIKEIGDMIIDYVTANTLKE